MSKLKTKSRGNKSVTLEYQVNIAYDARDQIYVARIPELEGCHTHGSTPSEALMQAHEAISLWLESAKENGIEIPEPLSRKSFSGKFIVRTPEDLHSTLAREALRRGKSMNEFTVELLKKALKVG